MTTQETVITTNIVVSSAMQQFDELIAMLDHSRSNLVNKAKGTGETIKGYADCLNMLYNITGSDGHVVTAWYERKGKLKQPINTERERFVKDMTLAGFDKPTITTYWSRVKKASGFIKVDNRVTGGKVNVDEVTKGELLTIINRIYKADEADDDTAKISVGLVHELVQAFELLGGDASKIK